jgi:hypothetical protein
VFDVHGFNELAYFFQNLFVVENFCELENGLFCFLPKNVLDAPRRILVWGKNKWGKFLKEKTAKLQRIHRIFFFFKFGLHERTLNDAVRGSLISHENVVLKYLII